mmetsp:Transcript_27696/g.62766  ORF Transcript_27696/g.62766 Transcript_27696/m.62766 type:complete len:171 (-) Transcript_27696:2-514(-)
MLHLAVRRSVVCCGVGAALALQSNLRGDSNPLLSRCDPGLISTACLSPKTANNIAAAVVEAAEWNSFKSRAPLDTFSWCSAWTAVRPAPWQGQRKNGFSLYLQLCDLSVHTGAETIGRERRTICRNEQLQQELEQAQTLAQEQGVVDSHATGRQAGHAAKPRRREVSLSC